jgi:hypothetical protein
MKRNNIFMFTIVVLFLISMSIPAAAGSPQILAVQTLDFISQMETVVNSAGVQPGQINSVRVLCPEGKVAIGGGIDMGNISTLEVTSSAPVFMENDQRLIFQPDGENPAPVGWQATARNNDTIPIVIKVGVICATLPGASSVVSSVLVAHNNYSIQRTMCPGVTVAVGGGVDLNHELNMVVTSSAPTFAENNQRLIFQPDGEHPAPVGWQASARNFAPGENLLKVAVICAPLSGVTVVISSTIVDQNNLSANYSACLGEKAAVNGGIDLGNLFTMSVTSTAPTFAENNQRLIFQPDGEHPPPIGWQVSARNNGINPVILKAAVICAETGGVIYLPIILK